MGRRTSAVQQPGLGEYERTQAKADDDRAVLVRLREAGSEWRGRRQVRVGPGGNHDHPAVCMASSGWSPASRTLAVVAGEGVSTPNAVTDYLGPPISVRSTSKTPN